MFGMSDGLLIVGVAAIILIFGAPKLKEWAKALGEAKKEFANASQETSTVKTVEATTTEVN